MQKSYQMWRTTNDKHLVIEILYNKMYNVPGVGCSEIAVGIGRGLIS